MLTQATRDSSSSVCASCSATCSLGTVQSTMRTLVLTGSERVRAEAQIAIERGDGAVGQGLVALGHVVAAGDEHGVVQLRRAGACLLFDRLDGGRETEA